MKIKTVLRSLGLTSKSALARELKISRSAVYQWGDDVPELRRYQIRELVANKARRAPTNGCAS